MTTKATSTDSFKRRKASRVKLTLSQQRSLGLMSIRLNCNACVPIKCIEVSSMLAIPVLNGIEAARLIKASAATRESRIIAYTGNASIPPPIERWFVAVVPKPSTPDVVVAAVQNACDL